MNFGSGKIGTLLVLGASLVLGARHSGPEYLDFPLLGMGNAGVATYENRHVLYLNPAGLRHIPKDFSLSLCGVLGTGDFAFEAIDFYNDNKVAFETGIDKLTPAQSDQFYLNLRRFDRKDIFFNLQGEGGLAGRMFGIGAFIRQELRANMDMGIFAPMMQGKSFSDVVAQFGFAFGKRDVWSVGIAPKTIFQFQVEKTISSAIGATANNKKKKKSSDPWKFNEEDWNLLLAVAGDLGAQWRPIPRHTIGAVLRDVGAGQGDFKLFPVMHFGYSWKADSTTESIFLRNTLFAFDYRGLGIEKVDVTNLYFGVQRTHRLFYLFDLAARLGASSGYLTAGCGISFMNSLHFNYATYAKENGDYAGQDMDRKHLLQAQIGF